MPEDEGAWLQSDLVKELHETQRKWKFCSEHELNILSSAGIGETNLQVKKAHWWAASLLVSTSIFLKQFLQNIQFLDSFSWALLSVIMLVHSLLFVSSKWWEYKPKCCFWAYALSESGFYIHFLSIHFQIFFFPKNTLLQLTLKKSSVLLLVLWHSLQPPAVNCVWCSFDPQHISHFPWAALHSLLNCEPILPILGSTFTHMLKVCF